MPCGGWLARKMMAQRRAGFGAAFADVVWTARACWSRFCGYAGEYMGCVDLRVGCCLQPRYERGLRAWYCCRAPAAMSHRRGGRGLSRLSFCVSRQILVFDRSEWGRVMVWGIDRAQVVGEHMWFAHSVPLSVSMGADSRSRRSQTTIDPTLSFWLMIAASRSVDMTACLRRGFRSALWTSRGQPVRSFVPL
jgi:hypothetical protein